MNLLPAVSPVTSPVPKTMNASIPVYHADGSLFACVSEQRLATLQAVGLVARVVRHRKGHINRAILFLRSGECKPLLAASPTGTRYSSKEVLKHGTVWELKHLDGSRGGKNYAPAETRAAFLQVVADCTVTRRAGDTASAVNTT